MIFGMESEVLEFKESTREISDALNDIVAILNKSGSGEVYFGIKNNGTVIGQTVVGSTLRDVSQAVGTRIKPVVYPSVEAVQIDNKDCVRVAFEGERAPYFADGKAFVRVADENRQMSPEALEDFFKTKRGQVSAWDSSPSGLSSDYINTNFVRSYIKRANEVGRLDYKFTNRDDTLRKLNLLEKGKPKNAAIAMFGKNPNLEINLAVFASKERLTFLDIDRQSGTIDQLVYQAEWYFRRNTRWRVVLDGSMKRQEIPEVPIEALRETLLNSYAHKNYLSPQLNELIIFSDRIEIYNPGTFPDGYSPEDFIFGEEQPVHRNPLLAQIMYYSKDIEGFGTGLKKIASECDAAGVRYEFKKKKQGFSVVFYRHRLPVEIGETEALAMTSSNDVGINVGINTDINVGISSTSDTSVKLTTRQKAVLKQLENKPKSTAKDIAEALEITERQAERIRKELRDSGIIMRIGTNKNGYWRINLLD